mgnify:CR=1 FL=1|tara:strand:+ start:665 stop:943 length:279 start_codon:yes stop_codon:yes gene_type:complete
MIYDCNSKYFNLIYIPVGFLLGDFLHSFYLQRTKKYDSIRNNKKNVTFNTELVNRKFDESVINTGSIIGGLFGFVVYFSKDEIVQKLYKKYF